MLPLKKFSISVTASLLISLGLPSGASAVLVGTDRQTGSLVEISTVDASTTFIKSVPDTVGLAFDTSINQLLGITPTSLYNVNSNSTIGSFSGVLGITGIAFGSAPNRLYSATLVNLLSISTTNASVTSVGPTGVDVGYVGYGAFTSDINHRLIMGTNVYSCGCALDANGDSLFSIDEATGASTLLYAGITGEGGFDAIAVDANNFLFGVTQQDDLLKVDLTNGNVTNIGHVPYASIRGLAFVPDFPAGQNVPEPSTTALLWIGVLGIGLSRRRWH